MSAIDPTRHYGSNYLGSVGAHETSQSVPDVKVDESRWNTRDTVEVSDEGRAYAETYRLGRSNVEREELANILRANLETLNKSRLDLDSHINAVLKKAGIKLLDGEKLRVETTAGGKIKIGGIEDKEKRKKIEEALNQESGLGKKISEFNSLQRRTSAELKADTGLSLQELIQEQKGERFSPFQAAVDKVQNKVTLNTGVEQFQLFADNSDLAPLVDGLGETSNIIYESRSTGITSPELKLKELVGKVHDAVTAVFNDKNRKAFGEAESAEVLNDPEFRKNELLNINAVAIKVGSDGSVEIEGELAGDSELDKWGKEFIETSMKEMMEEMDETGEINYFEEAGNRLVEDYQLAFEEDAAEDAKVEVAVGKGHVGVEVRMSSPSKEKELDSEIGVQANALIAELVDFEVEEPFEVEVNGDGKLSVSNLPEDEVKRKQVLQALEVINANVAAGDEGDEKYGALTRLVRHRGTFMPGGLDGIYADEKDGTATVTEYSVPAGYGIGVVATGDQERG